MQQPYNHDSFSKYRDLLQPYSNDRFSKKYLELPMQVENSVQSQHSFNACSKTKYRSFRKTLFYFISLSQSLLTDRITDGGTNTLAAHGLEELFFRLNFFVSFWFWREIGFPFTCLCTQSTIQLWCCVSFMVLAGSSFWCYVCTQCTIQLCSSVSFLVVAANSSQNEYTFLQKKTILLLYYDPLADVCIS